MQVQVATHIKGRRFLHRRLVLSDHTHISVNHDRRGIAHGRLIHRADGEIAIWRYWRFPGDGGIYGVKLASLEKPG